MIKKKLTALFLALVMVLAVAVPTMAYTPEDYYADAYAGAEYVVYYYDYEYPAYDVDGDAVNNAELKAVINAEPVIEVVIVTVPATCTAAGYTIEERFADGVMIWRGNQVITTPALGHSFTNTVWDGYGWLASGCPCGWRGYVGARVNKNGTYTVGRELPTCSLYAYTIQEVWVFGEMTWRGNQVITAPALGHDFQYSRCEGIHGLFQWGCTRCDWQGYDRNHVCTDVCCVVPVCDHNFVLTVNATCWTGAWNTMVCELCGEDDGATHGWVGALGHTFAPAVPTHNPRYDSQTCTVCDHQVYVRVTFFTVSFDSAGGSAVASQTVRADGLVEQPADPTRAGHTFAGWYYISPSWTQSYVFGGHRVNWDITLTAVWTPDTVYWTVNFDTNGGTTIESVQVAGGTPVGSILPTDPVRAGFEFDGWAFASGTLVDLNRVQNINHHNTLVAQWEAVPVTVVSASNVRLISVNNSNRITTITFEVLVTYSDGSTAPMVYSISVAANNNNIDGRYVFGADHDLAGMTLTYDIRGNGSNVRVFTLR